MKNPSFVEMTSHLSDREFELVNELMQEGWILDADGLVLRREEAE